MSAGTLTLTNNSAAVTGNGTVFTTEVAAGDFIVVTVGGVPYTLPVKSVESGTALTLVSNFTGPTQSGAAWYAVPRMALNMVTAAMVVQNTEALRGLNYDKQNWQQFFTADDDVTITLPDTSQMTGPSAKKLIGSVTGKMDKSQNLNDIPDKDEARKNIGLGSSATRDAYSSTGKMLSEGDFGVGSSYPPALAVNNPQSGLYTIEGDSSQVPPQAAGTGCGVIHINGSSYGLDIAGVMGGGGRLFARTYYNNTGREWREFYSTGNTTVDTNGFIKKASPVIKLKGDGTAVLNDEAEGVITEHISAGVYKISGVLGFHSEPIWGGVDGGFVIPANTNGLPLLWVDYEIDPDGSITLKTYHRTHDSAPEFARNLIGIKNEDGSFTETVQDGEPVDIPAGRWVDLRVEMPRNSLWNIKQQEVQEAREIAERKRQQNQQDTQP